MTDSTSASRREFLKTSAAVGGVLTTGLIPTVHAAGSDVIKVGLIGCGGRGNGAAENILEAAGSTYNIKMYALGDVFADRAQNCRNNLKGKPEFASKVDLADERVFVGFDAFEKVIACCDLVLLATPPGFRPQHIAAAVKAGKNVFCEKPVGVDGPGIRKVLAAYEEAQKKNLKVVAGTQRRHDQGYNENMAAIHDGAIGDIIAGRVYWNQGNIWAVKRQSNWNDMEYQIRNWYHFTWLCGDHICEQHVHNLDVANWAIGAHPARAVAMGGRAAHNGAEWGQSYDHFAVDFEWPNNVHVLSMCRQIEGCENNVSEAFVGTKGMWSGGFRLYNGGQVKRSDRAGRGRHGNAYVQEHIDLLDAIVNNKPINELKNVAESTLTAILGRLSAYTGKAVTWEQALNSKLDTFPKTLAWGPLPEPAGLAIPGLTELISAPTSNVFEGWVRPPLVATAGFFDVATARTVAATPGRPFSYISRNGD